MKKIILVTQAKGGTGKSALTYVLSKQYHEAIIIDTDDAFQTISGLLTDRKTTFFSFLGRYKEQDRGLFDVLFETVQHSAGQLFICDLSTPMAHQLLFYLSRDYNEIREVLKGILEELEIDLELHIVAAGGKGIFKPTMTYLEDIYLAANNDFTIKIYHNTYFPYSKDEEQFVKEYVKERNLELSHLEMVDCF